MLAAEFRVTHPLGILFEVVGLLADFVTSTGNRIDVAIQFADDLEMTGRHGEAVAESAAAVERGSGRDPEASDTWKQLRRKHEEHR